MKNGVFLKIVVFFLLVEFYLFFCDIEFVLFLKVF